MRGFKNDSIMLPYRSLIKYKTVWWLSRGHDPNIIALTHVGQLKMRLSWWRFGSRWSWCEVVHFLNLNWEQRPHSGYIDSLRTSELGLLLTFVMVIVTTAFHVCVLGDGCTACLLRASPSVNTHWLHCQRRAWCSSAGQLRSWLLI